MNGIYTIIDCTQGGVGTEWGLTLFAGGGQDRGDNLEASGTHHMYLYAQQTQERVNECAEAQGALAWLWGCGRDRIK